MIMRRMMAITKVDPDIKAESCISKPIVLSLYMEIKIIIVKQSSTDQDQNDDHHDDHDDQDNYDEMKSVCTQSMPLSCLAISFSLPVGWPPPSC